MDELKLNIPSINFDEIEKPSDTELMQEKQTNKDKDPVNLQMLGGDNNEPITDPMNQEPNNEEDLDFGSEDESEIVGAAEALHKLGYFTELPDDVDTDNFSLEDFVKTVKHNFDLQKGKEEDLKKDAADATFQKIVGKMSPLTQQLFEYELRGGAEESITDLAKTILYSSDIKGLSVTDIKDQERIVKEYYKATGETPQEIDERIKDLALANLLEKEAIRVKPKLDAKADEIAKDKTKQQELLYNQERDNKKKLETKVLDVLQGGDIDGIPVDQEMASFLYEALMNDEVPVVIKGKKVEVSVAESMILYHKYHPNGSVKQLMKSLYMLHDPEKFEGFYKKQAGTKEAERQVKENRISANTKSGKFITSETKTNTSMQPGRFINPMVKR